jgi:glycosyltransferase involved in cell wall biosynthesis
MCRSELLVNLALVGPVYPHRGGIAHYTTRLYQELIEQGHQVSLYSFKRQYPRWLFPGRTDRDPSALILRADGDRKVDTLNPVTWWAAARAIRSQQPDALILQWWVPYFAPLWMLLARVVRRAGIRVTFVCHNVLPHEQRPWDVWLVRLTLRKGDGFIVQSSGEREQLLKLLPRRRVEVAPMPVFDMFANRSIPQYEARRQLAVPDGVPILLFFGFVREYKGLRHLLDALSIVRTELTEVRLLVVGEFWHDRQSYIDQIARLEMQQNVIIVDRYVPNEELPVYFGAADVVVLPYTHATQSAVVQLAFGFGLPVITSRVGGLPELVTQGETGLLVKPGDPESLADAIHRFFVNDMGNEMRAAVNVDRERFTWANLVRVIESLAHVE